MSESNSGMSVAEGSPRISLTISYGNLIRADDEGQFRVEQPYLFESREASGRILASTRSVASIFLTQAQAQQWMSELATFAYPQEPEVEPVPLEVLLAEAARAES